MFVPVHVCYLLHILYVQLNRINRLLSLFGKYLFCCASLQLLVDICVR